MKPPKKDIPKTRMATSQEVYHRIMWDGKLNPKAFVIGFTDRVSKDGLREKPLIEWAEEGDIPWHRVQYIRCGHDMVWDREKRIDLFENDALPETAWASPEDSMQSFSGNLYFQRPVYSHNGDWNEYHGTMGNATIKSLSILSWNVLFDKYNIDIVRTAERIPHVVAQLKACNADILLLQEATPALLNEILSQEWSKNYYCSEAADGKTLDEHGLLILSRFPFSVLEYTFSEQKHFFAAEWKINNSAFHVALVHLTSNRSANADEVRRNQVDVILRYLNSVQGSAMVAGDFNTREENTLDSLLANGFVDVWQKLRPSEKGYTFDPVINTLAAKNTLSGLQGRLDRILLRGELESNAINMMGTNAIEGKTDLFPSDHFGLLASFKLKERTSDFDISVLQSMKPVYQSALVLIPDESTWPAIQGIRKLYDSKYERWMPHITLVYGFVEELHFETVLPFISEALKRIQPFDVLLAGYGHFDQRNVVSAYLKTVSENNAIEKLQAALQQLFPLCDEQITRGGGFNPHLSIGQFSSAEDMKSKLPKWKELSFTAGSVCLISRKADEAFQVKHLVRFQSGAVESSATNSLEHFIHQSFGSSSAKQQQLRQDVLEIIRQACSEVLGQDTPLNYLGSSRLGIQSTSSDTDVVILIPEGITQVEFLQALNETLNGIAEKARLVVDAHVPVLRIQIEGISVDVLCANTPYFPSGMEKISEEDYFRFSAASWQALNGCLEADKILRAVTPFVSAEIFRTLVKSIRLWAKGRNIVSNSWGFPGNFSWTLMTAYALTKLPDNRKRSCEELFRHCLQVFNAHDFKTPMALTEEGKKFALKTKRDRMPVITSVKPYANSTRNMTASTASIVQEEISASLRQLKKVESGQMDWKIFFNPMPLNGSQGHERLTPSEIKVVLKCEDSDLLETAMGWVDGRIVGFVISMEQHDIFVRPFPGWKISGNEAEASLYASGISESSTKEFLEEFEKEGLEVMMVIDIPRR